MKDPLLRDAIRCGVYPFLFVCVLWVVFLFQYYSDVNTLHWGILPRTLKGLAGIITSVFIHGDLQHLASNSLPLLVLGILLFYFYNSIAPWVVCWIWLVSGVWLWIGGRDGGIHPAWHIGASTLIYGLASFLFFSGIIRRHRPLMVVSMLVVFLYGSITWGIFPFKTEISWEGHLFGAIAGLFVAISYRGEGPQRQKYDWEEEEEEGEKNFYGPDEEEMPEEPRND